MKRFAFLPLILLLILLSSCSSIGEMVASGSEVPMWYPDGRQVSGAVCFVARGSGTSSGASRDNACNELLARVSDYLGYNVIGQYYRQLSQNSSIAELGLEIDSTFASRAQDGTHYYYIMAYADENIIAPLRSQERLVIVEMEGEIDRLKDSALENYMANNDVEAVNDMLRAVRIAAQYNITSESRSAGELIARAQHWLSNIELRLSRQRPESGQVTVRAVRSRGLLSPSIASAPVNASFTIRTHDNSLDTFTVPFVTDVDGRFVFDSHYPLMTSRGTVVFSLDIGDEIDAVAEVTGEDFVAPLRALADDIRVSFDYSITREPSSGPPLVIMDEFDESGTQLDSTWARDAFTSYFEAEGISTDVASTGDDNFNSALVSLLSDYSDYEWIIWSAVGLSDVAVQPDDYTVYVAEGYTILLNTRTMEIVNIDEITRSVSWGNDRDSALQSLFSMYGSSVAANMISYF